MILIKSFFVYIIVVVINIVYLQISLIAKFYYLYLCKKLFKKVNKTVLTLIMCIFGCLYSVFVLFSNSKYFFKKTA